MERVARQFRTDSDVPASVGRFVRYSPGGLKKDGWVLGSLPDARPVQIHKTKHSLH